MCGIVGYVGNSDARDTLINGLKRLEYRGYDSAGIAMISDKDINIVKKKGNIDELPKGDLRPSHIGIGHTRWATHGKPSDRNAHPFLDCNKKIALIHNGIIDNFVSLKEELEKKGHEFTSETDSEIIVHLLEDYYEGDLAEAMKKTISQLKGSFAVVALHVDKEEIVAARNESPLVLGIGAQENLIASDVPAVLEHTNEVIYLHDGDIVKVTDKDVHIMDEKGVKIERPIKEVDWSIEDAEKSGYEHYMLKEIHEQPKAIHESILGRLEGFQDNDLSRFDFDNIQLIACGTSYHAGMVGKYIFERITGIPCTTEMASEYRYSSKPDFLPLTILLSQSGETADTLAAAREAKKRGCKTIAITNVMDSSITREADEVIYTQAGPEIGVAATKTFTTQLIVLYLLAIEVGLIKNKISTEEAKKLRNELRRLPRKVENIFDSIDYIKDISKDLSKVSDIFFVGRNFNYPVALEGALKLKEIAYINAVGYPAGELKHGPFALLTPDTPVIAIAVRDHTWEKMLGNIGEIAARESPIISVGEDDKELKKLADNCIHIPKVSPIYSPILVNIVLQLIAYYTAYELNRPIDKPRNLAKSVTVE